MTSYCVINLAGEVTKKSPYIRIIKKGIGYVAEFYDNTILPFELRDNRVFVGGVPVFRSGISDEADINIEPGFLHKPGCPLDCVISYGNYWNSVETSHLYVDEEGMTRVDHIELLWDGVLTRSGVSELIGCGSNGSMNGGCSLSQRGELCQVTFPNGLVFPFKIDTCGATIVKSDVGFWKENMKEFFVRVTELRDDYVRFRITFITKNGFIEIDDIEYSSRYATHSRRSIKTSELTKMMLLHRG